MPHAVSEGSTGDTFVRGSGFGSLPGTVKFGNADATAVSRDGDTLLRAAHPALTPGDLVVEVGIPQNQLGLDRSRARLAVAASTAFAPADVASSVPGTKYALVFDDARQTLYVASVVGETPSATAAIERLVWNGSAWDSAAAITVPALRDLALSPGGDELVALTKDAIVRIDPVAGTVAGTTAMPSNINRPAARSFAVGNDGRWSINFVGNGGVATNLLYYDSVVESFTEDFTCCSVPGDIRSSGDGSVVYLTTWGGVTRYDVQTRAYAAGATATVGTRLSASRTGARFMVDGTRVYGSDFSTLGELSAAEPLIAGVITPDGQRAYAYSASAKLYAFNLESSQDGGFAAIGNAIALPTPVGGVPVMTTSVDGRTVFIAGDDRIAVQPGPP
jgi:hypothetical protein